MASTAISAQGTTLKVGATSGAKTITAITKANPGVITSTAHGLANGSVGTISAVAGMTEINGKSGVVVVLTANMFYIAGLDTTNFSTYTSGGSYTPTQITVNNVRSYNGLDGQRNEIDITNLSSTAEEIMLGIARFGMLSGEVDIDDTDAGQMVLRSAQIAAAASSYVLTLPNGKTRTFNALCKQFSEQGGVDATVRGNFALRITGQVAFA